MKFFSQILRLNPLWIIILALVLRLGWAVAIYEPSLMVYHGGDYTLYEIGADEILQKGFDFSNSIFLVRPPLFPLIIAIFDKNEMLILGFNCLMGALMLVPTIGLARLWGFSKQATALCAWIVALDPTSISNSAKLLAEPSANFLLTLGIWAFAHILKSDKQHRLLWVLITSLCLVLSTMSRPATYLLFIPLALWWAISSRTWRYVGIFFGICALGVGAWILHNGITFGNYAYTSIGTFNLLYYRAASVVYQATDIPIDQVYIDLSQAVENRIGSGLMVTEADWRYRFVASDGKTASAMNGVALDMFRQYPFAYVITIPIGLYRILLETNNLATPLLIPINYIWNALLVGGTIIGLWQARRTHPILFWVTSILCLYYVLGTLIVQTSGIDTRARSMLTPFMAIACVYAMITSNHMKNVIHILESRMPVKNQALGNLPK